MRPDQLAFESAQMLGQAAAPYDGNGVARAVRDSGRRRDI